MKTTRRTGNGITTEKRHYRRRWRRDVDIIIAEDGRWRKEEDGMTASQKTGNGTTKNKWDSKRKRMDRRHRGRRGIGSRRRGIILEDGTATWTAHRRRWRWKKKGDETTASRKMGNGTTEKRHHRRRLEMGLRRRGCVVEDIEMRKKIGSCKNERPAQKMGKKRIWRHHHWR